MWYNEKFHIIKSQDCLSNWFNKLTEMCTICLVFNLFKKFTMIKKEIWFKFPTNTIIPTKIWAWMFLAKFYLFSFKLWIVMSFKLYRESGTRIHSTFFAILTWKRINTRVFNSLKPGWNIPLHTCMFGKVYQTDMPETRDWGGTSTSKNGF